ncbi:MAG: DUF6037 family protein [Segniliparus sp.]|uniref:DUF6037 family protein n=1 Tax=Segniliparus sp. TaxID=2804064 RepID=UPI003F2CA974
MSAQPGNGHGEPIVMAGLGRLYRSMRASGRPWAQFGYRHRGKTDFVVVFFIDCEPFQLLLVARVGSFKTVLEMRPGFKVIPWIEEAKELYALYDALGIRPGDKEFGLRKFLGELDARVPRTAAQTRDPDPDHVAKARPDVDEADKIYFMRFMKNPDGHWPTAANLEKTRKLLGEKIHRACRERRISSCWSDKAADKRPVPDIDTV